MYFWLKYDLGQKYYAPKVRSDQSSSSWSWQYSSCHWNTCSNHPAMRDFYIDICTIYMLVLYVVKLTDTSTTVSKVAFIILSPSAIEASHPGLMRQSELFAIITQPIALMSVAACQASGISLNMSTHPGLNIWSWDDRYCLTKFRVCKQLKPWWGVPLQWCPMAIQVLLSVHAYTNAL